MILRERFKSLLKNLKYIKQERGAVFVLTAILLPVLFGCLGIGYDVGNIYMHKARLQNVADAAALAGGRAFLQSQTKTSGQDSVDGTMDYRSKEIANCTYKTGRSMTVKYEYGTQSSIDRGSTTKHKDADDAADAYINANIVNLGSTVYADKYSHFALNYGSADSQIFYRIGLYETVPLHFLPVLTNKYSETVRAGAVVVLKPGTTIESSGNTGESSNTSFSIFDNLFTYTDYLFTRNTITDDAGGVRAGATFTGTIAYTHLNGLTSTPGSEKKDDIFYFAENPKDNGTNDQNKENHLYDSRDVYFNDASIKTHINDAVTNTFYNTKEYLAAFQQKLNEPHVDVKQNTLTLGGDGNSSINSTCRDKYSLNGGGQYRKEGKVYYRVDSNGDVTFDEGGKKYKICYHEFDGKYVLCGKSDDDENYYLLNRNEKLSNCFIFVDTHNGYWTEELHKISINGAEKFLKLNWDGKFYYGERYNENTLVGIDVLKDSIELQKPEEGSSFVRESSSVTGTSNIYHFNADLLPNPTDTNITIKINNTIPEATDHSPIYIIIDDNIKSRINIDSDRNNEAFNTGRPIIIAYSGNCEFHVNLGHATLNLTLYMPNADYNASNFQGIFNGNIIARYINVAAGQEATWIQKNFLEDYYGYNDTDIQKVTAKIKTRVESANALLENAKITEDGETVSLKEYISKKLSSNDLAVEVSNLGDMNWYQNLSYREKQGLYVRWKNLYESKKGDSNFDQNLLNLLWPWNDHFDIGGDGSGETVTTPETLRLINFRTEYRENGDPEAVVDPFIYMTLGNPLAY